MSKLPPTPVGVPPGHSYWNDWYERLRTLINSTQINHNDTKNIQGGNTTERYHLSATQQSSLTGGGDSTQHFHASDRARANHTGTQDHNTTLSGLQGGSTSERFHLTSAEYTGTGTGNFVRQTSPTLITPTLGTPNSGTLTNCNGLPISTGVSGLGTGVATFLQSPSSANLAAAITDETGTGSLVFSNTSTLTGITTVAKVITAIGSASAPSGVATTVYTLPTISDTATYIVSGNLGNQGDAANYSAYAVIVTDGATAVARTTQNAPGLTITLSGMDIKITQASGITITARAIVTRIG